jgi:hypothetical protein
MFWFSPEPFQKYKLAAKKKEIPLYHQEKRERRKRKRLPPKVLRIS